MDFATPEAKNIRFTPPSHVKYRLYYKNDVGTIHYFFTKIKKNFDCFHSLTKIVLNNPVQNSLYVCSNTRIRGQELNISCLDIATDLNGLWDNLRLAFS